MFNRNDSGFSIDPFKAAIFLVMVTGAMCYSAYGACHFLIRRAHSTSTPQELHVSRLTNPPPSYYVTLTGVGLSETFVYEFNRERRKHWTNVIIAAGPATADDSPVPASEVNVVITSRRIHNQEDLEREFADGKISGMLNPDGYRDDMLERENPGIQAEKCFLLHHGDGEAAPTLEIVPILVVCLLAVGVCGYLWLRLGIVLLLGDDFALCSLPVDVTIGLIAGGLMGLGAGTMIVVMICNAETGGQDPILPSALLEIGAVLLGMGVGSLVERLVWPLVKPFIKPREDQSVIDQYVGGSGHAPLPPGGDVPSRW